MTRDDIIRMALEAGFLKHADALYTNHRFGDCIGELERFAAIVEAAKDVEHQQTLALQQRSYEREIQLEVEAEREAILDEWADRVQSDLENGVRYLNERAAEEWKEKYPGMAGFADAIYARGNK